MTTTEDIRKYLDEHGIDGAPAEMGWCAVEFRDGEAGVVFCDGHGNWSGAGTAACIEVDVVDGAMAQVTRERARRCGSFFRDSFVRHAPLTLAPPACRSAWNTARAKADPWSYGRDLDAEVVAGVQAGRDGLRGLAGKAST